MKPHRGGLILALGILSFVLCGVFTAIPAWIMGSSDIKEMDAGAMDPSGRGLTQAGKILGMVHCILWLLAILAFGGFLILGLVVGGVSKH
jgi:hypothetical protein